MPIAPRWFPAWRHWYVRLPIYGVGLLVLVLFVAGTSILTGFSIRSVGFVTVGALGILWKVMGWPAGI